MSEKIRKQFQQIKRCLIILQRPLISTVEGKFHNQKTEKNMGNTQTKFEP